MFCQMMQNSKQRIVRTFFEYDIVQLSLNTLSNKDLRYFRPTCTPDIHHTFIIIVLNWIKRLVLGNEMVAD